MKVLALSTPNPATSKLQASVAFLQAFRFFSFLFLPLGNPLIYQYATSTNSGTVRSGLHQGCDLGE